MIGHEYKKIIQIMAIRQECFIQKLVSYMTLLLSHPSWFQNIGFALVGIIFPLVVGIVIELEKERKVLDLSLIKPFIKPRVILFYCLFLFLIPLSFPALERFKGSECVFLISAFIVLSGWLVISISIFYFKIFSPLIGWIFSKEKRWNMRIEYLEKRKNELKKSENERRVLVNKIIEEWDCVWKEKAIPYKKEKELFHIFLEVVEIVQNEYIFAKNLFETIKQNLCYRNPDLYKACLNRFLHLYPKPSSTLDFLRKFICKDMPRAFGYHRIFGYWKNFVQEKQKEKIEKENELREITIDLLVKEIFFKNLNEFESLSGVLALERCSGIIGEAFVYVLKSKLEKVLQTLGDYKEEKKEAQEINIFFEKFTNIPNKLLIMTIWVFDGFIWQLKFDEKDPYDYKERFWAIIDLFKLLQKQKNQLCSLFVFALENEEKELLKRLSYTKMGIDELFKECKNYVCKIFNQKKVPDHAEGSKKPEN